MSREQEVARRRERARQEGLRAELVSGEPFLGRYRVTGRSGRAHEVKFRWARGAACRCDCQDYETKGLGTCKHIEAVWLHLEEHLGPERLSQQAARASRPSWAGAVLDRGSAVFFDLETQRIFEEVGGRHHLDRLGVSAAVTYSDADGGFRDYLEQDVPALIERLLQAPLIVGFNVLRFDYEVLAGYSAQADRLYGVPTLDMMLELEQSLNWRPGLESLARATLGTSKLATGLEAVEWFRQGRLSDVVRYCREDVEITRRLFEFGLSQGYLKVVDRQGQELSVPASWRAGAAA